MTAETQQTPKSAKETSSGPRWGLIIAPLVVFLALATMFGLALTSGDPSKLPSALIGKPVPQTDFEKLEGLEKLLGGAPKAGFAAADLKNGRVSVVNFWASWCRPCVEEHPHLVALKGLTDIDLYGVNYKDQPAAARRFLGRYGNPFTAVGVDTTGRKAIEWGVYGMPETFIIDGQGRIVHKHVGPITEASLKNVVLPTIEKARSGTNTAEKVGS